MKIRRAEKKDIPKLMDLLSQVLELHAAIRPDIFISGTTKYTARELEELIRNDETPVWVAADEEDAVAGYAFCRLREQPFSNNMVPFRSLFVDDLCVDEAYRGRHIGTQLLEFVREQARLLGCYEVTLNVWEGNDAAMGFYRAMGFRPKETQMEFILKETKAEPL